MSTAASEPLFAAILADGCPGPGAGDDLRWCRPMVRLLPSTTPATDRTACTTGPLPLDVALLVREFGTVVADQEP
jgi:hypothetical protein